MGQFNLDTLEDWRWFPLYQHCCSPTSSGYSEGATALATSRPGGPACQGAWIYIQIYIQTPARRSGDATLFGQLSSLGCGRH